MAGSPPVFQLEPSAQLAQPHGSLAQGILGIGHCAKAESANECRNASAVGLQYIATVYRTNSTA